MKTFKQFLSEVVAMQPTLFDEPETLSSEGEQERALPDNISEKDLGYIWNKILNDLIAEFNRLRERLKKLGYTDVQIEERINSIIRSFRADFFPTGRNTPNNQGSQLYRHWLEMLEKFINGEGHTR